MPGYFERTDTGPLDPTAVLTGCIEAGKRSLLLDEHAMPNELFDLSTGLLGELLNKLTNYRVRLAGVVPDLSVHSTRFQEFAREADRGAQFRFFPTRQEAIDWLESAKSR